MFRLETKMPFYFGKPCVTYFSPSFRVRSDEKHSILLRPFFSVTARHGWYVPILKKRNMYIKSGSSTFLGYYIYIDIYNAENAYGFSSATFVRRSYVELGLQACIDRHTFIETQIYRFSRRQKRSDGAFIRYSTAATFK